MNEHKSHYIAEDEIDLKKIFLTIKNNFSKIIILVIVVSLSTLIYILSIPNVYSSSTILAPENESSTSSFGGLSALAGFAGVNIGTNNGLNVELSYKSLLNDREFMFDFIKKNHFDKKILDKNLDKSYIFALSFRYIYDLKKELFNSKSNEKETKSENETLFNISKKLKNILSISTDRETGFITISVTHSSRNFSKEIVESFLNDATKYLINRDTKDINQKIKYYKEELLQTNDITLKEELSKLISRLIQKKVLAKSNQLYNAKQIIKPQVAFTEEKLKPMRAMILVVSFISSFIFGIFFVFFIESAKKRKETA